MPTPDEKIEAASPRRLGPVDSRGGPQAHAWLAENFSRIEDENMVSIHGGRGSVIWDKTAVSAFNRVMQVGDSYLVDYIYRCTLRTKVGGRIFIAINYPADRTIPLHNKSRKLMPAPIGSSHRQSAVLIPNLQGYPGP